jgi:hypothetical protein
MMVMVMKARILWQAVDDGSACDDADHDGDSVDVILMQIKLGTLDQEHVEIEWQLRSFTRSAKKAKLGDVSET